MLPIEKLSIPSQGDKTKSNETAVFSKISSVRRVLNWQLKALKEQEELQARLTKLKQKEIVDLKEELGRKARLSGKEIEKAKMSSNCRSSLRSTSPVGAPDNNLTKVLG